MVGGIGLTTQEHLDSRSAISPRHPCCHTPKGPFSTPDFDEMVEDLVLNHNLSIMARDMDTNTPLAVVLNGVMGEKEALVPRSEVSMKTKLFGIVLYLDDFKSFRR